MTKRECAIVTAYTGRSMVQGETIGAFYRYLEEKAGRVVYTHEIPDILDLYEEEILDDFINLARTATEG